MIGEKRAFAPLLVVIVAAAGWLRLQHCHEGLPYLHQWDEPQTASTALRMLRSGDFNPHFFHYGSLMIYLSLGVDILHAFSLLGTRPGAPEALEAVGNIVINDDTGWHWTISHPSFYFWNRVIVAAMGTATVALVGLIGRRIAGPIVGLAAAALLAGASVPIDESTVIMNDAPLTFFVVWAAWEALRFQQEERLGALARSLVAVGLGTGCKYTACIALILPLTALFLVYARPGARLSGWAWPALALVPITFLLTTPCAVLDLPEFMNQVGYELRHYKVLGHGESSVTPGWPNLDIQLREIHACLGTIPCVLAVLGAFTLWRRDGWVVWLFAVVYATYMSNTRINFTRNFLVLYPFVVLLAGLSLGAIHGRLNGRARGAFGAAVALSGVAWLALAVPAARAAREPETRTEMMTQLSRSAWKSIGIPEELRIHELDLRQLRRKDVRVAPLRALLCGSDRDVVVVPVQFRSNADPFGALAMSVLLPPVEAALLHGATGRGDMWLDRPSTSPQLRVIAPRPACPGFQVPALELDRPAGFTGEVRAVLATGPGAIGAFRPLEAGRWVAHWMLRSAGAQGARVVLGTGDQRTEVGVSSDWDVYTQSFDHGGGDVHVWVDVLEAVDREDQGVEVAGVWVSP